MRVWDGFDSSHDVFSVVFHCRQSQLLQVKLPLPLSGMDQLSQRDQMQVMAALNEMQMQELMVQVSPHVICPTFPETV